MLGFRVFGFGFGASGNLGPFQVVTSYSSPIEGTPLHTPFLKLSLKGFGFRGIMGKSDERILNWVNTNTLHRLQYM